MNLFKRLVKVIEANLNELVTKLENNQNKDHLKDKEAFDTFDKMAQKIADTEEEVDKKPKGKFN